MTSTLQLLFLSTLATLPGLASKDKVSQTKSVRSIRQADLDSIRDKVLPLVECHAGRKFKSIPKLEIIHNSSLRLILKDEFGEQFKRQFPTLTDRELKRSVSQLASLTSRSLLGKFDFHSKVLYILPRKFDQLASTGQITKGTQLDLLTIIVAHELTHALQDSCFPLGKAIAKIHDQAGMHAYSGRIEGHATYIQDLVAKDLQLEDSAKEYHALLVGNKVKGTKNFALRYKRQLSTFYYSSAARFFKALEKEGGKEAVWKLFENPPHRSDFLHDFSAWNSKKATPPAENSQLLAPLARLITRRPRQTMASTADQTLLRCFLASASIKQTDEILNPLRQAWFVQVGGYPTMGLILGMKFADRQSAKRFFEVAPMLIHDELSNSTGYQSKLQDQVKLDGQAPSQTNAILDRTDLSYIYRKDKFGQVKGRIHWYLQNRYVIQVDISNFRTKAAQMDKIAQHALALMTTRTRGM